MSNVKETEKIVTGLVRFIYPNVITPRAFKEGQEKKYSTMVVIDKTDTATVEAILDKITAAKDAGKLKGTFKQPLKDGDAEFPDDANFKGKYFLNARSKFKPGVVDAYKKPITDPEIFYGGCYGRAVLTFLAYSEGSKGVCARLKAVQKIKDGERVGGGDNTDAFDDDFVTDHVGEDDIL